MLKDDYRETRFRELAKRDGVPDPKVERMLKKKGVSSTYLLFDLCLLYFSHHLQTQFTMSLSGTRDI